jgi:hypothetical protein
VVNVTLRDDRVARALMKLERVGLEPVLGETFTDHTVYVDGRNFMGCTFVRCTLVTETGHFGFTSKTSWEESRFAVLGPAAAVVNAYTLFEQHRGVPGVATATVDGRTDA